MPLFFPVVSMASYTAETISLMVYSVTARSCPPYSFWEIKGRPMALWRVWWVMA